jgi:hypothetical protein
LEGNIPRIHPAPPTLVLITVGTRWRCLAGRVEGATVPWACARLGWLGPPPPLPSCFPTRPGSRCWRVLGLVLLWLWPIAPLCLLAPSEKRIPDIVSPVSGVCFCYHVNSTGTSGNMSVAQVYVCINVYFPPFWNYVGGINVSITTTNKLPQAYPLLVLEQKLRHWLLIRSCNYADYISNMLGL